MGNALFLKAVQLPKSCPSILSVWIMGLPTTHRWTGSYVWDRDRGLQDSHTPTDSIAHVSGNAGHGRCLLPKVPLLLCPLDLKSVCRISGFAQYSPSMAVPSRTMHGLSLGCALCRNDENLDFEKCEFGTLSISVHMTRLSCALWTLHSILFHLFPFLLSLILLSVQSI